MNDHTIKKEKLKSHHPVHFFSTQDECPHSVESETKRMYLVRNSPGA